ncbi:phage tail protein [Mesorhizobium sp. KR9-304]|uniref:COG4223 family protein n=1 Tax=Mesorhizobium sp. KR9-304 TaxID=3156614 RepID=UPI0032B4FF1B
MVKTPRTRHSTAQREPVTIELGPDEVSRLAAEDKAATAEHGADPAKQDIGAPEAVAESPFEATSGEPPQETTDGEPAAEQSSETAPEPASAFADETKPDASRAVPDEPAEGPRPSAAQSEPRTAPPPARSSRGSAVTAGVAGGIVALLAGGLLQFAGILGTPGSTSGSAEPSVPAAVEAEIAALKSEIEGLKSGAGNTGDMTGRVDALSQAFDQVKADVAALKQAVVSGGGDSAGLGALNAKIAEIETRIAAIGPGADGAIPEEIAAINEKIAGVEVLVKAAGEAASVVDGRLGALEQSVSTLATKVDSQAAQPKIALAIAASALKAAIERGAPFLPEIETFAAIAPRAPGLSELRPYAEKGVATRADILAETDAAANAIIAAASPPPANAGFFERLLSSAESLVTVRPIGAVEGPGVPETVARMEVALQAGDLAKAVAEFDTLPEPAKAAGAIFADKIRARLTVEQLADQAIAAAMQAA